jgi:hypothetical protein
MLRILFLIVVLLAFSQSAYAQALAYVCDFPQGYSWESTGENYKGEKTSETMNFTLTVDSPNTGKMIGNAGASEVSVLDTAEGTSFLEQTPSGNIAVTTVFKATQSNKRKAVHSRHMNLLENPLISQYVGNCELKN